MKGILGRDSREFLAFFLSLLSIAASNCLCDSLISSAHSKGSNWYIGNRNDMFFFVVLCCYVAALAMPQQRLFSLLSPLRHHQSNGQRLTFDRWSQYFVISGSCPSQALNFSHLPLRVRKQQRHLGTKSSSNLSVIFFLLIMGSRCARAMPQTYRTHKTGIKIYVQLQ